MKIQLSSTLPFTPVQLDSRHVAPRRAVGQLHGMDGTREYHTPVYEFRHGADDEIFYHIDPLERLYPDEQAAASTSSNLSKLASQPGALEWIQHDDSLSYKPYAFLVMNAMTHLVGDWDGVVYRTPSGERLHDAVWNKTLQVLDACVCNKQGLWVMVDMLGDTDRPDTAVAPSRQLGWVPLRSVAH